MASHTPSNNERDLEMAIQVYREMDTPALQDRQREFRELHGKLCRQRQNFKSIYSISGIITFILCALSIVALLNARAFETQTDYLVVLSLGPIAFLIWQHYSAKHKRAEAFCLHEIRAIEGALQERS